MWWQLRMMVLKHPSYFIDLSPSHYHIGQREWLHYQKSLTNLFAVSTRKIAFNKKARWVYYEQNGVCHEYLIESWEEEKQGIVTQAGNKSGHHTTVPIYNAYLFVVSVWKLIIIPCNHVLFFCFYLLLYQPHECRIKACKSISHLYNFWIQFIYSCHWTCSLMHSNCLKN